MYISYKTLCKKIFTSEGYSFVQSGDFHILGKNISIADDDFMNFLTLCLYENDQVFYIKIRYPQASIWNNAISVYNNSNEKIIYSEFIEKKDGMIINNSEDINNLTNIIKLYKLIYPTNTSLDVVRYEHQIYLTKGVF
jgi:hypothetical protein